MKYSNHKLLTIPGSVLLAFAAQNAASAVLEEIIVTAQKRSENLQDVPISVAAFTADGLKRAGINNVMNLDMVTPGLVMQRQLGNAIPVLRGISTSSSAPGNENPVAYYVDGVYLPYMSSNNFPLNNLERIEVLKGPQGTLFGRNATGGLVNVVTKDPTQEFSTDVEVSIANYERFGGEAYISGGLTDNIAADLAVVYYDQNDYYGKNVRTGNGIGYEDNLSLRSKIVIDVSEDTRVKLAAAFSDNQGDNGMTRKVYPGFSAFGSVTPNGFHDIDSTFDPGWDTQYTSFSMHVEHEAENVNFLSLTAYSESEGFHHLDQDNTPAPVIDARLFTDGDMFSQEFQISSNYDSPLQWITGIFYMQSLEGYKPFSINGTALHNNHQDTTSYAGFVQATYALTDATNLTAGFRYTKDEREATVESLVGAPSGKLEKSWTDPNFRIALDHRLSDKTMIYASYNTGFKSGTYNMVSLTLNPANPNSKPANPETLDAYEIGLKTDLLEDTLRLNFAAFYYEYEDMQIQNIAPGGTALVNAAESEIRGLEMTAEWLASSNLSVNAGLSLMDTEYTDWPDASFFVPQPLTGPGIISCSPGANFYTCIGDASGRSISKVPDFTFNLGFNYVIPADTGNFNVSMNYLYNDGFYWETANILEQDSYNVLNGEVGWQTPDEKARIRLYGQNLTDEEYSNVSDSGSLGAALNSAPPRTYGVAVRYSF